MSDCFIPDALACLRTAAINTSNSCIEGGVIALRMTTSSAPKTMNCEPDFNLRRLRMSSGMTIYPFDDIFVVARFSMFSLLF